MTDAATVTRQAFIDADRQKLLRTQKIQAYLAAWIIEEIQRWLGIASTERLRLPTPDYRYYHVDAPAGRVKAFPFGENSQTNEYIDIYLDLDTNTAEVYAPSVQSFIRPDRIIDFDMLAIDPDKPTREGTIETTVNFTEALDRVPTWHAMPVPKFDELPNRPPTVKGLDL